MRGFRAPRPVTALTHTRIRHAPACPGAERGGTRALAPAERLHTASGSHPLPPSGHTIRAWRHVVTTAALGRRAHSHSGDAHASAQGGTLNHSHTQTQRPDETPRWRVQRHDRTATMPGLPGDPRDPDADLLARPRPSPCKYACLFHNASHASFRNDATLRAARHDAFPDGTRLVCNGWYVTVGM